MWFSFFHTIHLPSSPTPRAGSKITTRRNSAHRASVRTEFRIHRTGNFAATRRQKHQIVLGHVHEKPKQNNEENNEADAYRGRRQLHTSSIANKTHELLARPVFATANFVYVDIRDTQSSRFKFIFHCIDAPLKL